MFTCISYTNAVEMGQKLEISTQMYGLQLEADQRWHERTKLRLKKTTFQ